eukprot:scaffold120_cov59-Cylindrotheca_fusiformis.AAC.5
MFYVFVDCCQSFVQWLVHADGWSFLATGICYCCARVRVRVTSSFSNITRTMRSQTGVFSFLLMRAWHVLRQA